MQPKDDVTEQDDVTGRYTSAFPVYAAYATRLHALMSDLLKSENLEVVQIESRAKAVESLIQKIQRKKSSESDPLQSVTDLVGIRIITYYLEDVARVGELLGREFTIDAENSMDKAEALASDQFGYRSAHYVITLDDSRADLLEWAPFKGMKAEVQVRTSLQHAWAAVSHKLEYKSSQAAPAQLQRRLFRLSALFEMADEQFSILRDESNATDSAYRAEVRKGRLDVPIDSSSIAAYMSITGRADEYRTMFKESGHQTEDIKPVPADRIRRDQSDLVKVLKAVGITTLEELDEYLSEKDRLEKIAKRLDAVFEDDSGEGSIFDLLTLVVLLDRDKSPAPGLPIYTEEFSARIAALREELQSKSSRRSNSGRRPSAS